MIQNFHLWKAYKVECTKINQKLKKEPKILHLWHGTRQNDPKLIYDGEVGFDMTYSAAGMWGRALYFAKNASYSKDYSFVHPDNQRTMFLAEVLLGDYAKLGKNKSLLRPPPKPDGTPYDSVKGQTGNSDVYMVYNNCKAYPRYLVTYTV